MPKPKPKPSSPDGNALFREIHETRGDVEGLMDILRREGAGPSGLGDISEATRPGRERHTNGHNAFLYTDAAYRGTSKER